MCFFCVVVFVEFADGKVVFVELEAGHVDMGVSQHQPQAPTLPAEWTDNLKLSTNIDN